MWAKIRGFGATQWSEDVSHPDPQRSMEEAPRVDEEYSVALDKSLFSPGTAFWILFMPALSFFDGWPDHPEELDQSYLVHCLALRTSEASAPWYFGKPMRGFQVVKVLDLIRIRELQRRFEEDLSGSVPDIPKSLKKRFDWQDLTLFDANLEGDIGCWLICRKTGGTHTALLYGEWGAEDWDCVYAGNRPLSSDEYSIIGSDA